MRIFFIIIVLFAAAVGVALSARFDPGNVVFFYPPYRVDLSLNLFVGFAILFFAVLYAALRLIRNTVQLPQRVAQYRLRQREKRAYRALRGALQAYFEGRYGHAEKQAQEAQGLPEAAGLSSLVGARAAHRMSEFTRRDEWLRRADSAGGLRTARLMTEAECLVDARDSARALDVVSQLHAAGARHIQSLRLALKANQYAAQWDEVLRLLRMLNKRDAIHPAAAHQIKIVAYRALLDARTSDGYSLIAFWQDVPQPDRRLPDIALAAAQAFNRAQLGYQARMILEPALAQVWDARLVEEFGHCVEQNSNSQIERAERWLASHPGDASLQYALGMLCVRAGLWGKAQIYLNGALSDDRETSLAGRVHLEMARMFESIGDKEEAATHFREAALFQGISPLEPPGQARNEG